MDNKKESRYRWKGKIGDDGRLGSIRAQQEMRGMNLQQLRYFVAISQFGHYGQAAKALYVTQSALSNSIKKLEGELGVRLFEHQGRNAVLTDRGKVFAARISPILNDLDNAISEI